MTKIENARKILKELGVTEKQQKDLVCNVLLALANIKEDSKWTNAENNWMRIHDITTYLRENYDIDYAENSRETIRKEALHHSSMQHLLKIIINLLTVRIINID